MTNGSNAKRKKKQPARYTPEEADPVQDGDFYPLFQNQLPVPLQYPRRQHPGNAPETPALDPVAPPFSPSSATPATSSATPSSASEVGVTPDTLATPSTASRDKDGGLTTADAAAARPVIVSSSIREGSLGHIDNDEKSEEAGEAKERHGILVAPVQRRGSSVSLSSKPVTLEGRYSAVRDMEDPFNDLFDAAAGPGSRPR
ncbi:hypothetical protein VD0002_g942 [Verticillium dahliae]|uniref:Uncharacterized protein n=1 Tax=Verticillium dahliae TaxID=27337 RepID=A0AA45AMZ7_VERDA|nr:hypothetical protein BJF96_g3084 [Verticillium dahliae]PNH51448.1 hypothetical protein VD0003_g5817 [Verticillium dahliae]PNH69424.1 hypothetical protein VD0002_g942 [Verticillium dahliae]